MDNFSLRKRSKVRTWNLHVAYSGELHFVVEKGGTASRWNTLRALTVLKGFKHSAISDR